ncbi:hypothetical protein R0J87_19905, partial [Halomonas sp. SIMBA_159]
LPEEALSARAAPVGVADVASAPRRRGLSARGERLARLRKVGGVASAAFTPGLPDLDGFPFDVWSRLMSKAWRRPPRDLLANTEPSGYLPLRR